MHPDPPLMGRTPREAADVEMWTLRMDHELSQMISLAFLHSSEFYRDRIEQIPEVANWARGRAIETMTWLDRELAGRRHIAGENYTLADIVGQCACVLERMRMSRPSVCCVIGAGDATGSAIARRFAKEEYTVCVARRNEEALRPLIQEIRDQGGNAFAFGMDARR